MWKKTLHQSPHSGRAGAVLSILVGGGRGRGSIRGDCGWNRPKSRGRRGFGLWRGLPPVPPLPLGDVQCSVRCCNRGSSAFFTPEWKAITCEIWWPMRFLFFLKKMKIFQKNPEKSQNDSNSMEFPRWFLARSAPEILKNKIETQLRPPQPRLQQPPLPVRRRLVTMLRTRCVSLSHRGSKKSQVL